MVVTNMDLDRQSWKAKALKSKPRNRTAPSPLQPCTTTDTCELSEEGLGLKAQDSGCKVRG